MYDNVYLIFVNGVDANNNKFYDMAVDPDNQNFTATWGRVGDVGKKTVYPISKWHSTIKSKIKKGYKDISDLKAMPVIVGVASNNTDFDSFYNVFSSYTGSSVKKTYLIDKCSPLQMNEAQNILNSIITLKDVDSINHNLQELYKVIPRRMGNVKHHLITDIKDITSIISKEQDALDSMDSNNAIHVSNPFTNLDITFKEAEVTTEIRDFILGTLSNKSVKIHKLFRISKDSLDDRYDKWMLTQKNKHDKLLIHGTRNPNIFSILKSGLMIRPTNAAMISGAAYGDGIYHSSHTQKSLGYTGWDNDKIFFLNKVHLGDFYTYQGYYRDGKDLSRSEMSYPGLQKRGKDSLYVAPGDGLLNSEYIIFKEDQHKFEYLLWLK